MMSEGSGLLLLSVIGGYWTLERAETHKGELRRIGRLLGGAIIIASLLGLVFRCWAVCQWTKSRGGWSCPFMSKSTPASEPAVQRKP